MKNQEREDGTQVAQECGAPKFVRMGTSKKLLRGEGDLKCLSPDRWGQAFLFQSIRWLSHRLLCVGFGWFFAK